MTAIEREKSGCPFRVCFGDDDVCKIAAEIVTGYLMCEVDWESCSDYIRKAREENGD